MNTVLNLEELNKGPKRALLTGITGQDGSYLAELLLEKGYEVHGIIRRSSSFNTGRIDHIYRDRHETGVKLFLHYGDLSDSTNLFHIINTIKPQEIYNLGAMSHVAVSFEMSEYTADVDGVGTLRLLNAIRSCGLTDFTRFYQASTSELYGEFMGFLFYRIYAMLCSQHDLELASQFIRIHIMYSHYPH